MSESTRDAFLEHLAEALASPKGDGDAVITVAGLIEACPTLALQPLAGAAALERPIRARALQQLGLALRGYTEDLVRDSVQLLGRAELRYLREAGDADPTALLAPLRGSGIACFLVPELTPEAAESAVPAYLRQLADAHGLPVLISPRDRIKVEMRVSQLLERQLSPSVTIHGDLVAYCGLGLLLLGRSGSGKSDCALDLITHGHQLVADDMVNLRCNPLGQIIGRAREMIRYHMDVRGVGIVNVKELFSIYSVLDEHTVDLVIYLHEFDSRHWRHFDPDAELEILGVKKPLLHLPVAHGRSWHNMIQVAVRNFILKSRSGYDACAELARNLERELSRSARLNEPEP